MIEARGLIKAYGQKQAVKGLDLHVKKGEFFGFLGPNGAGKSSTLRMISCVSMPTDGSLSILGMDPQTQSTEIKSRLGVVPQEDTLDNELSVRQNIIIYGRYFGMSRKAAAARADELLEFAQLTERKDDRVEELSGGMKRRLTIARALVNQPDMMLLDEPTTGLDPQARHLLWDRLRELKRQGVTMVLTTHYMDEAEQLCDRIVVIDAGRVIAEDSPQALISTHVGREVVEVQRHAIDEAQQTVEGVLAHVSTHSTGSQVLSTRLMLHCADGNAVVDALRGLNIHPSGILARRASLEDVFLTLTGHTLVD